MPVIARRSFSARWPVAPPRSPSKFAPTRVQRGILPVMKALVLAAFLVGVGCAGAQTQAPAAPSTAAEPAAPTLKSWFIRLVPPRPTFDKDMTTSEQTLMEQHFAFWKDQFDKGVCLFGGPVFDPGGVYGVVVIRAVDEAKAGSIAAGDPAVKASLFRMEVAEMRIAFLPKKN